MPNSNENSKRNKEIYSKRRAGSTIISLAKEYDLSLPRIHRICIREENKVLKTENAMLRVELNACRRKSNGIPNQ